MLYEFGGGGGGGGGGGAYTWMGLIFGILRYLNNRLPQIIALPQPLSILSRGTPITVNPKIAEVESDPAKRISDDSSFDAEYIDIENCLGTIFGTL